MRHLTRPSGPGELRAEARRRGGVFDLVMGVGRADALIQTFWGIFRLTAPSEPSLLQKSPQPRQQSSLSPLCAFAPLRETSPSGSGWAGVVRWVTGPFLGEETMR